MKRSKLTALDVAQIRVELAQGFTQAELAQIYGVHRSTISDIKNGWTWRDREVSRG